MEYNLLAIVSVLYLFYFVRVLCWDFKFMLTGLFRFAGSAVEGHNFISLA